MLAFTFVVLTPADEENHVNKHPFKIPFVCGARDLGEALRRISEGAAMIRTKGEAGTGMCILLYLYYTFTDTCLKHIRSELGKLMHSSLSIKPNV